LMGGLLGSLAAPDVFQVVFTTIFEQVTNFNDREFIPGVYVLNASSTSNTTSDYTDIDYYNAWVPITNPNSGEDVYYVVEGNRDINATVTVTQGLTVVIILWDDDHSLITIINKLLEIYNMLDEMNITEGQEPTEEQQQQISEKVSEVATYILIHINDIITGDEQLIFQPSYYYNYEINGTINDTRTWYNASGNMEVVDPATIPGISDAIQQEDYIGYLAKENSTWDSNVDGPLSDTIFFFHLFQLWMQRFHVEIDMAKLAAAITAEQQGENVSEDAFQNVIEGCEINFTLTQHHLTGGLLFNDTNGDGVPTVEYEDTGYNYTDSRNESLSVMVPVSNEVKYVMDLADSGTSDWTVMMPTVIGNSIKWQVTFNNPTVQFKPPGLDEYQAALADKSYEYPMDYMSFGFTFEPSWTEVAVPDAEGNTVRTVNFGKGTIKLDQSFGNISGLPQNLSDLSLGIVYFSHVFTFGLDFENVDVPMEEVADTSNVGNYYRNETGTIDFLDQSAGDVKYFAHVDIAGPNYETGGGTYPAHTTIIPWLMFNYTFSAAGTVENDAFSQSQGEGEYRQQSLFVDMTSAWAFYCVAYPEWTGAELIHD
ncbi:MAG: hypothetical protein ACTSRA_23115, partial [Promethearchaeota archaeon]